MIVPAHRCFLSTQNQSSALSQSRGLQKVGYECKGALGLQRCQRIAHPTRRKPNRVAIALREFHFECIEEQLDEQTEVRAHGIDMTELPTRGTSAAANFISFLY
jgi:hypothetical protein